MAERFIQESDYNKVIRTEIQSIITGGNTAAREAAENAAQAEMVSYLTRFDVSRIFAIPRLYRYGQEYVAGDGILFATTPWEATEEIVANIYSHFEDDGIRYIYMGLDNVAGSPIDNPSAVIQLARSNTPALDLYTCTTATEGIATNLPNHNFCWAPSDPRHPLIVTYMVDICLYHLHAAINPRNIPDLRVERRNNAIEWLTMLRDGKLGSGELPLLPDSEGQILRFGGGNKKSHYF